MAKGMLFPVQVNPLGGAKLVENSELVRQMIILALLPASSLHPWNQNLAPEENFIFDINDRRTGGLFAAHVYNVFDVLQKRNIAALPKDGSGLSIKPSSDEGEMEVVINYVDLELKKSREIRFGPSGELR